MKLYVNQFTCKLSPRTENGKARSVWFPRSCTFENGWERFEAVGNLLLGVSCTGSAKSGQAVFRFHFSGLNLKSNCCSIYTCTCVLARYVYMGGCLHVQMYVCVYVSHVCFSTSKLLITLPSPAIFLLSPFPAIITLFSSACFSCSWIMRHSSSSSSLRRCSSAAFRAASSCACMYVCVCVCVCAYVHICVYVFLNNAPMRVSTHICIRIVE